MTRFGRALVPPAAIVMMAMLVCSGCRLFEGGRSKDGGTGNRQGDSTASGDPLLGGKYIPKQDIPIPGKSDLAEARDPLLRAGASSSRAEPFRLGPDQTTAALAGSSRDDVPRLDDKRSKNEAGRGPVPFTAPGTTPGERRNESSDLTASIPTLASQLDTLRSWNAKFSDPVRDANGDYSFSAEVPFPDGPTRRYEGAGRSPAAAVYQVVDQIRTDRGR